MPLVAVAKSASRTIAAMTSVGRNFAAAFAGIVLCGVLVSCGSSKSSSATPPTPPNIAGQWEFIAISTDGSVTGIEAALTEGQVLVNGITLPSGQVSASSAQIAFVSLTNISQNYNATGFGGSCGATSTSTNSLGPGSVTNYGSPASFAFTANGSVFNVTATLSSDGKSMTNGTYTPQSGNACSDPGGTITGAAVSLVAGMYSGQMCPLASGSSCSDPSDNVTATLTTKSGQVNLDMALTGTDNANLTLAGPQTGNAFSVQGTFEGQTVSYYGYFEVVNSVPAFYLVSAADACFSNPGDTCTTAAVIPLQQTP